MSDAAFVNRQMSIALDLVRAGAAFVVLAGHARQLGLYRGYWPFTAMLQHNAVIVFFVLSGLVIATSVAGKHTTLWDFAAARATRILPVSLFALAFSAAVFVLFDAQGKELSAAAIMLPMLFLSESFFGTGLEWNPPYWSLCYEVWYYALFAAAYYLRGWRRVACLILLVLAAGFKVLLLLPVWLMGVMLARAGAGGTIGPVRGLLYLVAALWFFGFATSNALVSSEVLLLLSGPFSDQFGFSEYVLTDLLLGLAVMLCFAGLRPIADRFATQLVRGERPIRFAAGFSFTLYLLHWPIISVLLGLSITAGDSIPVFVVLLIGICSFCAAIAFVIERQRGALQGRVAKAFRHHAVA